MTVLGWESFDQEVVAGIRKGDLSHIRKALDGGMRCPLKGHDHWLGWAPGGYAKGTEPHDDPDVRFRVSPTYIYEHPLENFIAGDSLVGDALEGKWKKAETFRLGHENSEDALSWNVFRSLQEAGELHTAAHLLAGVHTKLEPELLLWGRRILSDATEPSTEIQGALQLLEPSLRQQTEPDVIMRVHGWGWVFIEAKLGSATPTYARRPERVAEWIKRYVGPCSGVFNKVALESAEAKTFPEQILRNVALASRVCSDGEQACVVALSRKSDRTPITEWVQPYLSDGTSVTFVQSTWEALYESLPPSRELLGLRGYLENKSRNLRPAFDLAP
jgi:hypothetical protein